MSPSPTGAMRDVFESRREALDEALKAFPLIPDQVGLLAVINGEAAGFDIVSRPAAYAQLHGKLIKSYVMDALVDKKAVDADPDIATKVAHEFIAQATHCEEMRFKSPGYGDDYRLKAARIAGSALVHGGIVIHTAFFLLDQAMSDGRMSGLKRRRSYHAY